jgi:glycosyltransferase involved in cell wall biosynthesis
MKVLFTSPILEHPAAGGPQLRIENSIKALSTVCELDVVSRATLSPELARRTEEYLRPYCREFVTSPRARRQPSHSRIVRVLTRSLRRAWDADSREDAHFLLSEIDRRRPDVVWFGYGNISFGVMRRIRAARPKLKLVCDTDSVWSRFVLRELPFATGLRKLRIAWSGKRKQHEERAWVELCDVTTAVSEVDAQYYRSLTRRTDRVQIFPNVIDVEAYKAPLARVNGFHSPAIYLAGSFGHYHSPMDSAARWMLERVLPALLRVRPELHFYIVGANSDRGFGHLNGRNITATGRVESVLPYLRHADVAVVPLQFESGTRFKILEAAACGVPLVSTTLGAEGLPVVDGEHLLLADDADGFAQAILRLLDDKAYATRLAGNCRKLVEEGFTVQALAREGQKIFNSMSRQP